MAHAKKVLPEEKWLPAALSKCKKCLIEKDSYYRFVKNDHANKSGSKWQFERQFVIKDTEHGKVILDVLKGGHIGGISFHD